MKLGKLHRIELRDFWKHEATGFTRWLSEPENLALLADEVGIDIELIEVEAGIGRYSADILAREVNTERKIIIENQLEATDHGHLGQILTYAAGVEAEYIIWIVREAREEHKRAVEWLNGRTDDRVNFFLVQIELWRIGNSEAAPKFVSVARPNEWARQLQENAFSQTTPSKTQVLQLEFWQGLQEYAVEKGPPLKFHSPRARHWLNMSIGRSDAKVVLTLLSTENQVGCELYIRDSKPLFHALYSNRAEIEQEIGIGSLSWQALPGKKASRIRSFMEFNLKNDDREAAYQWLLGTAAKFRKAFSRTWSVPENGIPLSEETTDEASNSSELDDINDD